VGVAEHPPTTTVIITTMENQRWMEELGEEDLVQILQVVAQNDDGEYDEGEEENDFVNLEDDGSEDPESFFHDYDGHIGVTSPVSASNLDPPTTNNPAAFARFEERMWWPTQQGQNPEHQPQPSHLHSLDDCYWSSPQDQVVPDEEDKSEGMMDLPARPS